MLVPDRPLPGLLARSAAEQNSSTHNLQGAGFAADSVRTIQAVRRESPSVQILLFSATFDDTVKRFAMKVVPGANQVSGACCPGAAM